MDKKLLDSLSNLSLALEDIAAALKDKSEAQSATAKAMKGGDFVKEIKEINVGVKALQKDTKQILANQQTIMNMAKSKSGKKENVAEGLGKDKTAQKNFKEGLGVILLIAVAVLAIGAAFLLIGKVNFFSVIALSIALPLLAIGFAKIHKILKEAGFNPKVDAVNFIIAITSISIGITLSSMILSMVTPLSFSKFFTATFIALTFAMLGPSIYKFLMAFKEMSWGQLIKSVVGFAIILPAIALGIAFASWAFQLIKPIGFSQFLTAVGIGIVFAIISFGIRKLLKSFDGLNPKDLIQAVIFLPLILPAIALGIAGASYAFQLIKPIGFVQFLTAVGIAIVFAVISYGIRKMLKSFEGLDPATMLVAAVMLPILLVAVSYAIAYSSVALGKIKPISFSQFLTAVGVAAVFVVLSFGIAKIVNGIRRMNYSDLPKIPVFMVLVAIAITASSYILSMAKVIPAATLLKIVLYGIALAIVAASIGGVMALFSKMKVGIKDALMGTLLIVVIAVAVMVSSHILALGNYKNYPDWKWALGVGLSLIAFTPAIVLLGAIAMSGFGALAILAGAGMVLIVAATITAASYILGAGKYGNYPPVSWSASVAISMAAFTAGMVVLGALIIGTFGLGGLMLAAGAEAVLTVADTIVQASLILEKGKYTGGPTLAWAGGIALALGAFAPVYAMMMANSILSLFGGGGVGPDDFATAIKTVSRGIVDAAGFFANNKAAFINGPSKEWSEGVGLAIGAFAPVYKMLEDFPFSGGQKMSAAIITISRGIIDSANIFAANKATFDEGYPSENWGKGVGAALNAFAPVFKALSEDTGWFTSGDEVIGNMLKGITYITSALVSSGIAFFIAGDIWGSYPSEKWASGVKSTVVGFMDIFQAIEDKGLTMARFTINSMILRSAISNISSSARMLFDSQKYFKFMLDPKWVFNLSKNVLPYAALTSQLDKILGYDEKATLKQGGFLGFGQSTTTTTVRKMKDVSIINRIVSQMVDTARILWSNQKFFKDFKLDSNWVYNLHWNLENYAKLTRILEKILTINEVKTMSLGPFGKYSVETTRAADVGIINKVVNQLVVTARILHKNKELFGFKIDPNYMKSIASNVMTFADLANNLSKKQKGQSALDEMLGLDPISRVAKGMVKIANAYDTLAKAVKNFSGAINGLNVGKLQEFRVLTGNLAMLSAMDSTMFSNMLKVLESRSGVFANMLQIQTAELGKRPAVKTGAGATGVQSKKTDESSYHKDAKGETQLQKLDKVILLLKTIKDEAQGINLYLHNPKETNADMGSKGDG